MKNIGVILPEEGKLYEVYPETIDQSIFQVKRDDPRKEEIRKLILKAFEEMKKYPERYYRPFGLFYFKKNWQYKSVDEIKALGLTLGDETATWVHQLLQWAQILQNEDAWEIMFSEPDDATDYRLVIWKDDCLIAVGGSKQHAMDISSVQVEPRIRTMAIDEAIGKRLVPLVVAYL